MLRCIFQLLINLNSQSVLANGEGVKGCLPPSSFKTSHFTSLKILKNTLDYPPKTFETPHLTPPPQSKQLDRPWLRFGDKCGSGLSPNQSWNLKNFESTNNIINV